VFSFEPMVAHRDMFTNAASGFDVMSTAYRVIAHGGVANRREPLRRFATLHHRAQVAPLSLDSRSVEKQPLSDVLVTRAATVANRSMSPSPRVTVAAGSHCAADANHADRLFNSGRRRRAGSLRRPRPPRIGSTRIKAQLEWNMTRAVTLEASLFPSSAQGVMLAADIPGKESRTYRQPVGVVGMIGPWNFPLHLSSRSVAPAIALGNAAAVKAASDTPVSGGLLLGKIYEEAGLPAGVLNVLIAKGSTTGDALVRHPVPRVVSFTAVTSERIRHGFVLHGDPWKLTRR
jgi:hypothetical protein